MSLNYILILGQMKKRVKLLFTPILAYGVFITFNEFTRNPGFSLLITFTVTVFFLWIIFREAVR
ncbi:hypothetical protein SAMN04488109_5559 [Chryseolinea serpens]|uniref:Uncharacterized protein n=1 Tax=Chryseolinea serpens TaxID=947013 RepID=A0A1M5W0C1_9BACT|nr:hypothetical protein SAMN04488109_5559 [Chryseolinea serpens]